MCMCISYSHEAAVVVTDLHNSKRDLSDSYGLNFQRIERNFNFLSFEQQQKIALPPRGLLFFHWKIEIVHIMTVDF